MTSLDTTTGPSANVSSEVELEADQAGERIYYPCSTGFLFTAPCLSIRLQLPFYGMIVLSVDGSPVRIRLNDEIVEHTAVAIWCKDVYFDVPSTPFVCIGVNPLHTSFRSFVQLGPTTAVALKRESFAQYEVLLRAASFSRRFEHGDALSLFHGAIAATHESLPRTPGLDSRAQRLMKQVCERPRVTLSELADDLQLSYHRTSHLFAEAVGLPVRTYQLWQKLYRAGASLIKGASLTEVAHAAGFVDSAHYSKAFQTAYGRNPSEMFKTRRYIVFYRDAFSESSMGATIQSAGRDERAAQAPRVA